MSKNSDPHLLSRVPPASSSEAQHHRPDPPPELNFCMIIAQELALRKYGSYIKNNFIVAFLS